MKNLQVVMVIIFVACDFSSRYHFPSDWSQPTVNMSKSKQSVHTFLLNSHGMRRRLLLIPFETRLQS